MRLSEGLQLRVKDVGFEYEKIVVRNGKRQKDRVTILPDRLIAPLQEPRGRVRALFDADREASRGGVTVPHALHRKYPDAATSWRWLYLFPARAPSRSAIRALGPPPCRPAPRPAGDADRRQA
jgi:integrase